MRNKKFLEIQATRREGVKKYEHIIMDNSGIDYRMDCIGHHEDGLTPGTGNGYITGHSRCTCWGIYHESAGCTRSDGIQPLQHPHSSLWSDHTRLAGPGYEGIININNII